MTGPRRGKAANAAPLAIEAVTVAEAVANDVSPGLDTVGGVVAVTIVVEPLYTPITLILDVSVILRRAAKLLMKVVM